MWTKILSNKMLVKGLHMQPILLIAATIVVVYNGAVRADHPAFELSDEVLGTELIAQLRNDANLDLSVDEEYEDLRAELLAYHTTLAKLSAAAAETRRSLSSTPCWKLDGICVNYKLCTGFRYLTQVPGCRGRLKVCCLTWNRSQLRDHKIHDLHPPVYPWGKQYEFGGKGILGNDPRNDNRTKSVKVQSKLKGPQENLTSDIKADIGDTGLAKAKKNKGKKAIPSSSSSSSEVVVNPNVDVRRSLQLDRKSGFETEDNGAQKTFKIIMVKTF